MKTNVIVVYEDFVLNRLSTTARGMSALAGLEPNKSTFISHEAHLVRLYPSLGFALFETESDLADDLINELNGCDDVAYARKDDGYRILDEVDESPVDLLDNNVATWHWNMTGIQRLKEKGLTGMNVCIGLLDSGCERLQGELDDKIKRFVVVNESSAVHIEPRDLYGHGTKVASVIAGNSTGVSSSASLYVAAIAEDGKTTFAKILSGLDWLIGEAPDLRLINMSVGKIEEPTPELEILVSRLREKNILLICAIGNDGEGITYAPGNMESVLGIGSINIQREVSIFSGGGTFVKDGITYVKPDMVMPGEAIPARGVDGKLKLVSGTSFAAPMLTGLGALLIEENPGVTAANLENMIIDHCYNLPSPAFRDGHGLPVFI